MSLERKVEFIGGYSWRGEPDYGIHCMDIFFSVKGALGAITIRIFTNWHLPEHQRQTAEMYTHYPFEPIDLCRPNIVDVGYHSKTPQYEGHSPMRGDCELTDGPCYSDGTSLWGNECWRDGFLHGGSEWLFARMEDEYRHRFEDGPPVDLTPIPRTKPERTK